MTMLPGQAVKVGPWLSVTVTVKLHELLLPEVSEAVQVTVVTPLANAVPEAGEHVTVRAPSQASLAVGVVYVATAVHNPGSVLTEMLVEQPAKVGPWLSLTVTVKLHELLLPDVSEAEQVTVVTPLANELPEAGVQVTGRAPSQTSVAVGAVYVTVAEQVPAPVLAVRLDGHAVRVGP